MRIRMCLRVCMYVCLCVGGKDCGKKFSIVTNLCTKGLNLEINFVTLINISNELENIPFRSQSKFKSFDCMCQLYQSSFVRMHNLTNSHTVGAQNFMGNLWYAWITGCGWTALIELFNYFVL
jgi:hypothetical protein